MNRGTYRSVVAACVLAACLLLAVPQSADARLLEPSSRSIPGAEEPQEELTLLERLWQAIESLWQRDGVLIIPD